MKSGEPFAMAGLWETWKDAHDNVVPSCTTITTTANHFLAPIHKRSPLRLITIAMTGRNSLPG